MKQVFLTSSCNRVAHDLVKHIDLSRGKRLAFINTAAEVETGNKKWQEDDRQSLIDAGFEVFDYTLTDKKSDQLERDLNQVDVLYVSGGNNAYLLEKAQQSGFIPLVREYVEQQGKIYIGTSAGSIVAGPSIFPALITEKAKLAPNLQGYDGFNLVNFCVFPHWGSEYFKELYLNRRLVHAYTADQVPLVILTDHQYVHVKDDWMQIRTVT